MPAIRLLSLCAIFSVVSACTHTTQGAPATPKTSVELVDIKEVNSHVVLDMRYATTNNFVGQKVYKTGRCLLRSEVAERLNRVQVALESRGLGIKVFDCYRPPAAQQRFWEIMPDERYVSNPAKGSRHTKGTAVDLTIIDDKGAELEMPSAFDDFTQRAHRNDNGASQLANQNMKLLEDLMSQQGFEGLPTEWWHFDLKNWRNYNDFNLDL